MTQSNPHHGALQETYVLHDGPPYANGELHIGVRIKHAVRTHTWNQPASTADSSILATRILLLRRFQAYYLFVSAWLTHQATLFKPPKHHADADIIFSVTCQGMH